MDSLEITKPPAPRRPGHWRCAERYVGIMLRIGYIDAVAGRPAEIVDHRLAGTRGCWAGRHRHGSWPRLELAHRCWNSADNRVNGTLSDHVRIGCLHDGTRP